MSEYPEDEYDRLHPEAGEQTAGQTWRIEGHGVLSEGRPAYYVATLYEGGIPSRIITALLREDLEWVIAQGQRDDALRALEDLNVTVKTVTNAGTIEHQSLCWKGDFDSISDTELRAEVLRWLLLNQQKAG